MNDIKIPKKLIEVSLPLDDINSAAAREKSIRHGHPSTLHLWWARRPLAACRAVIFSQMVNDPGYQQDRGFKFGVNKEKAAIEREKLFDVIRDLVKWENINNEEVLNRARAEIKKSWIETCELNKNHPEAESLFNPEKLPAFHDPFAGGGAIPLEAQRLGLESYASDLNPVAVMITKAMIEIPPKFSGQVPVGPIPANEKQQKLSEDWSGSKGLAEDVRRYGHWMREEAKKRIGHLYPKVEITEHMVEERDDLAPYLGQKLSVIAWLWVKTIKSSNPAFSQVDVPLASSFVLSSKKGNSAWVEPIIEGNSYRFVVRLGETPLEAKNGTKSGRGANFNCLLSKSPMSKEYIRSEFKAKRSGEKLMAVVVEGKRGRIYLPPQATMEELAKSATPEWKPEFAMNQDCKDLISGRGYGITSWHELFTNRQLIALTTFSDLVQEIRSKVIEDAKQSGMVDDGVSIHAGGSGATAYGDKVAVYLSLAHGKATDYNSSISSWGSSRQSIRNTFGRQAIPMVWDFAEANILGDSTGCFLSGITQVSRVLDKLTPGFNGVVKQQDAATQEISKHKVISTDPPYYDNIGYADLSDYFYIWMRRCLKNIYPSLFSTIVVPKAEELVAIPYRHGSKKAAESFFMNGMFRAINNISEQAHPAFPVTIYYAFKQSDTKEGSTSSTGWETFLEAVIKAGFSIVGTWPMRTEMLNRLVSSGANTLASSVVLVCRKRNTSAESISRRQFQQQLREEMPEALESMIGSSGYISPIAPVDLAQASIGPGIGIFSKYESILNQDGSSMSVYDALILINRAITDYLTPDTGHYDNDTLFCDVWFSEYGWSTGDFGQANVLAQGKGTTVDGVKDAGVIESGSGKVRLLKWIEYPNDWNPITDNRTPVWEACHHLIRELNHKGEIGAGELLARMPEHGEKVRQLAYHLYTICERKGWAEDARAYNELITSWHAIIEAAHTSGLSGSQPELF
jgi:putative DNA methylase